MLPSLKTLVRKTLFAGPWGGPVRSAFHTLATAAAHTRLRVGRGFAIAHEADAVRIAKGGRTLILKAPSSTREEWEAMAGFDGLFSLSALRREGDTIDVRGELELDGRRIRTSLGSLLEYGQMGEYTHAYKPQAGDVLIDAGAYHGLWALSQSAAVGPQGRIYCFEPDERNAAALEENLKRNGIANVVLVRKGLWKEDGALAFASSHDACAHVVFEKEEGPDPAPAPAMDENARIEVISLSNFCRQEGISPALIKMDIEGAELEVVEDLLPLARERPIHFAVASYHLRDERPTWGKVEELLNSIGYEVRTERGVITYAQPKAEKKG